MENNQEPKSRGEDFSFIKETIKPRFTSRERFFAQIVKLAICGFIFGIFACCSFFALKPWAERTFAVETEKVTIPQDQEAEKPTEEQDTVVENQNSFAQILDAKNYEQMIDSLYLTAQEARKCVVSVRKKAQVNLNEVLNKNSSRPPSAAGIIVADNGKELLILADYAACRSNDDWNIVFADDVAYPANIRAYDKTRGLIVFGVNKGKISESTMSKIKIATLGNSNLVTQGEGMIGIGNMFGYEDGLSYGVASSVEHSEIYPDGRCRLIATDIAIAQAGSGVLFNQKGEVVGLIRQGVMKDNQADIAERTANALAISELKEVIELMLNGEKVPYAGVYGVAVNAEIAEAHNIPEGLYITEVEGDSPAMAAGIQNGDVIQYMNGEIIKGIASFENVLLDCKEGSIVQIQGKRRGSEDYVDAKFSMTVGTRK